MPQPSQSTVGTVVALGAGRMGRSIALAYAHRGQAVTIIDFKTRAEADFLALEQQIHQEMAETIKSLVSLGMVPDSEQSQILSLISVAPLSAAESVLAQASLVFEGVPETLEAKKDALSRVSALCAPEVVIASTTSTMLADELMPFVHEPSRFLNAHWLNPAFLIPLVEVSTHQHTSTQALSFLQNSLKAVGKVPVQCQGAGFIVPRLQALIMNEAARMVEEGVASAEDIDLATRYGLGFRFAAIGLLEFIDFGGADILYYANQYLAQTIDANRYACPDIIKNKMDAGQLGLKTGSGFFEYQVDQVAEIREEVLARNFAMLKQVGLAPTY